MSQPIRLVVIDDHALIREGIKVRLRDAEGVDVVGEAAAAAAAEDLVAETAPDIALIDIGLPDASGLDLARRLLDRGTGLRVIILTMHEDEEYVRQAVEVGVHGYVLKDMAPDTLLEALTSVAGGDVYYPPAISQIALRAVANRQRRDRPGLAARERQVLVLLAQGFINKEIADQLSLSVRTVETYRERLMKKLDIRTVAGLTRYAIAQGLVSSH